MKISLKWLNDFVDVKEYLQKPEALAEVLTKAGLEVESIENKARDFENVVTGLILEKDKHPNADKLSLCRVTTGEGVVHQIVCGAQNHKANDRVVVALPGAILPGNFEIKKAVVRGVESGGMLCSLKELGLATESQGIEILPENAPIGKSFAEYKGYDDVTFELKVTANRADCLSHYGLAREVACLLSRELKKPQPEPALNSAATAEQIGLDVKALELCPRYTGRYFRGVKVGPSPEWLSKRLEMVGLNSINNVVDCTNYVMMELGQPLHAFDASQLKGRKIIVDKSQSGEKFTTLDGTELTLTGEELMIKDSERSVCIAGVIGGKNSGVTESTQEIFLESAYFAPVSARKSLRSHGLNTDSGYRFARGVDPEGTMVALNRATELILKVAGGEAFSNPHDIYPTPQKKAPVRLKVQTITDRLGYSADSRKFENFMQRLGCVVETLQPEQEYQILPPSYRFDLEMDMDLVEEYARLNGYDQIPETMPLLALTPTAHDSNYLLHRQSLEVLRAQGFSQASHLIFVGTKAQAQFLKSIQTLNAAGLKTTEMPVKVLNPLNEEQDALRQTLSYGLYRNLLANFHQGNELGRLFEIGKVFHYEAPEKYQESWRLGLSAWGYVQGLWQKEPQHSLVFELKAAVEALLQKFHISSYQWVPVSNKGEIPDFLHRGQAAHLMVEGKKVGFIGALHPLLLEEGKIRVPVALSELDLDSLLKGQPRLKRVESLSRFPSIQRDLALLMARPVKVGEVSKEIQSVAGPLLVGLDVFDVYEGDKLEPGQKSVAFRLIYQDKKDTLRDQPVNESIDKVLQHLKAKFQISVR
ncbi:MAG: phenylalanine--tRNA ligase subunit beta [Pseudobdellovibrionaceae bacterium]